MIPSPTSELRPAPPSLARTDTGDGPQDGTNIFAALLTALSAPERYRLIQHNGEIYIEPIS